MSGSIPVPNYYFSNPLEAASMLSTRGIWHGTDQSPAKKYLHTLELTSTTAFIGPFRLCDYLLYYPGIDADTTDTQVLDNTQAAIARYTDGEGVQVMAVVQAPATVSNGSFTFDYINQDGVLRTSPFQGTGAALGTLGNVYTSAQGANVNTCGGPFLKLASNDTGVRSIESVTFSVATGGLIVLVLLRPLKNLAPREAGNPVEFIGGRDGPVVEVLDGAHLNLVAYTSSVAANTVVSGTANFIWSN